MATPEVDTSPYAPLPTRAPFNLEATVRVLQRRSVNPVERWEDGRYQRVLRTQRGLVLVEVENRGTTDAPDLRWWSRTSTPGLADASLAGTVRKILGLDVDPGPLQRLTGADPALGPVALALRGMRPPRFAEWFEAFANVIPFQQVSLDAGTAVVGRFIRRFGERLELDGKQYQAFPTAAVIADASQDELRACGLSHHKATSLRVIAEAIATGELSETNIAALSTGDAIKALTALPGIGPWTANVILLRGLGRLDAFPPGDSGILRGLRKLMNLAPGAPLAIEVEHFGDYRGYFYFCVLGGSLLGKGLIRPP